MRALTMWRPGRELSAIHNEIDNMFDRFFKDDQWWMRPFDGDVVPAIDSFLREGNLIVRADLPGIDPKEVELKVDGNRLTIKGERKAVKEGKEGEPYYREVSYGRFERSIALPEGVDADSVKATYHDGILEVTMKAPKAMVPRKVPVTVH
jgi:HSP20 family protein